MCQASGTYGHFPLIPGKPGKFSGERATVGTARRRLKTANLENQPLGIGKCVPVGPLNGKPVPLMGDNPTAGPTQDSAVILDWFFTNHFIRIRSITQNIRPGVVFEI